MERVFICSPFRGAEEKNMEPARKYARFAYEKGCLPVVPHFYFPAVPQPVHNLKYKA